AMRIAVTLVLPILLILSLLGVDFRYSRPLGQERPAADGARRLPVTTRRHVRPLGYCAHDCYRERIRIRPRAPRRHQPPITTITRCRPCTRS
ncbi:hypothetical protein FA379_29440, partial [Pseudomonas aeruginosa]|nr:hypothetical protein [Pseudomonas aeruginosa]